MATYSMMGLPFAILRPVAALVTSLFGGLAVGHWERKGALDDMTTEGNYEFSELPKGLWNKVKETLKYGFFDMMQSIGRWLLIGLVVATLITVLLPDDFFSTYARWPLLNMFIIVLVAVPMYVCATGSIPIAAALMLKGMSPGCALVLRYDIPLRIDTPLRAALCGSDRRRYCPLSATPASACHLPMPLLCLSIEKVLYIRFFA